MAHPWKLEELSYSDIGSLQYEVALLPVGSTEPHGLHLPYGQDSFHTAEVADRVCRLANARGAKIIRLPVIPYGVETNQRSFPFALNVHQSTLNLVIRDLIDSLDHQGIRKVVILNGHGGNEFKSFLREQYGRREMFLSLVNWWTVAEDVGREVFSHPDDHAGEMETSVALYLFAKLVHLDRAGDGATAKTGFEAINEGWVQITRPWHLFTKDSTAGDPREATAAKGERYLEATIDRISGYLEKLSSTPYDEDLPYSG